jgi:CheY-like chemotaxis protein
MGFFSALWPFNPKILVVEDAPEVLSLVRDVLAAAGYRVVTASDGVQGLAAFRKERFDLVILDYNMPRMGGAELLILIRGTGRGRKTPVIMLSAEQMLDPINRAYDQGIVAWIPKPFSATVLLDKVDANLKGKK